MSRLRCIFSTLSLLSALFCLNITGIDAAAAARDAETTDPAANLPPRHREFLEEVAPLLSDKEREAFIGLARDYQRDAFIRRFWDVRDPEPKTGRNEFHEQWNERLEMAREQLGGTTGDRARVLLLAGPPRSISQASCDALLPLEFWDYDRSDRNKRGFTIAFVAPSGSSRGPWRLWYPGEGLSTLMSVEMRLRSMGGVKDQDLIADSCSQDILGRLGPAVDWDQLQKNVQLVPRPSDEWLATFLARSTEVPEGAPEFPARADYSFPGRFGSRTVVQGLVSVPRAEVRPERLEKASAYNFVVDGEVLYRGELFEQFRYRFLFPEAEATADTFPLVFQRYLRPGTYTLVLKVEDTGGRRFWRETRELEIPPADQAGTAVATAPAVPASPGTPGIAGTAAGALAEANTPDFGSDERTIRILPPPPGLITGAVRIEARTTGEGISRVRFFLNGKPVLTKAKPPYSIEINLGDAPKIHTLQALALGAKDEKLAEDQILLNTGPHRFSIRLIEPQPGKAYQSSLRAQAQVDLPEGERLDRVEIYLNDTLLASLYQPPYVQPVILPANAGLSYVRAVAWLADGNSTEDVVLINAPDAGEELDVDFVELFTNVVDRKGKAVEGLTEKDFTVLEDGVPQQVRRFELVNDLPIYAGVMIDTSSSMGENGGERLEEAVKSASRFFEKVIKPKDRAAVFTFSDTPTLGVRFTNQMDVLTGALQGLTAEGNTALYDSLIYALYYFGGIKGKKAIILLSDGQDSGSHYSFSEALDYARRSGVAIYSVGIDLSQKDIDVRAKLQKLAEETGGRSFFISAATELEKVFATVEEELRSQYLLAYQSTNQSRDDKFRTVEVKVAKPGLEAKTARGYYP